MNSYDKGDVVRCSGAFTNSTTAAVTDPTVVKFSFLDPNQATTTYTYGIDAQLMKDSTGNYHVDVDADIVGVYHWRLYSTGTGKAAAEDKFRVRHSAF